MPLGHNHKQYTHQAFGLIIGEGPIIIWLLNLSKFIFLGMFQTFEIEKIVKQTLDLQDLPFEVSL